MNSIYKINFKSFFSIIGLPGYVLFLRTIVMALISRKREFEEVASIDSSAMVQILLASVSLGTGIYIYSKNKICRMLILKSSLKWLLYFNIWALISTLWSVDPMMTAYRAFETIAYLFLLSSVIARLYSRLNIDAMIQWVMYYAIFAIFISVLNRARQFGLDIFSIKNLFQEQMGSTPYFFLALLLPVGIIVRVFILPISIFSLSNTAYAGMASGLLALKNGKKWVKTLFFVSLIGITITTLVVGIEPILKKTIFYGKEGIGKEYTSGRDQIAELSWGKAIEKPFTGHGFVAGETFIVNQEFIGAIGTHNGLLSALLGTGFLGAILLLIFIVNMLITSNSKYLPTLYRSAFLSSVILITFHTMGNPGIGSRVYGTWIPAVLIFTLISMVQFHFKNQQ